MFSPQDLSQIIQVFAQEFENNKRKRNEFNIVRMLLRSNYDLTSNTIFPVNLLFISSNIPAAWVYGVCISKLIAYSWDCRQYNVFMDIYQLLRQKATLTSLRWSNTLKHIVQFQVNKRRNETEQIQIQKSMNDVVPRKISNFYFQTELLL